MPVVSTAMKRSPALFGLLLLLFIAAFVLLFVLVPIVNGIVQTLIVEGELSTATYQKIFGGQNRATLEALSNSLLLSFATVLLAGFVGTTLAIACSMPAMPLRHLVSSLAPLPLAMPPLVGTVAFLFVFGEGGVIPRLFGLLAANEGSPFFLDGWGAILAVHVFAFNSYFFLFVRSSLKMLDSSQLDAAIVLGASKGMTFRKVVLPQMRQALLGASALVFMSSMASFSAPLIWGGATPFLTTIIYATKLNGDLDLAAAQSVLLMAASLVFYLLLTATMRSRPGERRKGTVRTGMIPLARALSLFLYGVSMLVVLIEILPVLAILVMSCVPEGGWTWTLFPERWSFGNYRSLFTDSSVFDPVWHSASMSLLAVLFCIVIGGGLAFLITKGIFRPARRILDPLLSLPFGIPGTVVGIYLILAFGTPQAWNGGVVLLGTFWILPIAYVFRSYPVLLRSVASSLERVDDSLMEAASTFGGSFLYNVRRVLVPLVLPGIVSGSLLVAINAMGEFPSSILLFTHSNRPVSVEILSQLRSYNLGSASAYSVMLLVVVFFSTRLSSRITGRGGGFDI
jgi:iron(III) transport system permease protein